MKKVVLDTNVLASATIVKEGHSGQILQAWQRGEIELIISPQILEEVKDVLLRPRIRKQQWMTEQEVEVLLQAIEQVATHVRGSLDVNVIEKDPEDNKFLAAAKEGKAQYVISGDRHLLKVRNFEGIQIVSPKRFLETS